MTDFLKYITDPDLEKIADKITGNRRISPEDGLLLYEKAGLPLLGILADWSAEKKMACLCFITGIFTSNLQTDVSTTAASVHIIKVPVIPAAGITVSIRCWI